MKTDYTDILERLGPPLWWDEAGVPRYQEFSPNQIVLAGAREALLIEIACQGCGEVFQVALSSRKKEFVELARKGQLGYGDPPVTGCCALGPTLRSIPLRILQFWRREDHTWEAREDLQGPLCWPGAEIKMENLPETKSHEYIQGLIDSRKQQ